MTNGRNGAPKTPAVKYRPKDRLQLPPRAVQAAVQRQCWATGHRPGNSGSDAVCRIAVRNSAGRATGRGDQLQLRVQMVLWSWTDAESAGRNNHQRQSHARVP